MVRSGAHGEGDELALSQGVVGIGWPELGDLSDVTDVVELRATLERAYPSDKPGRLANWAGQIEAFCRGIAIGDRVALPLKSAPAIAFGTVTGDYQYVPDAVESMRHQRAVTWTHEAVPRDTIP